LPHPKMSFKTSQRITNSSHTESVLDEKTTIAKLQKEITELRKHEREYSSYSQQMNNYEHRYDLLQEEKNRQESEYEKRIDTHLQTIADLKTDIDSLKNNLFQKNIENQDLKAEKEAIKEVSDNKNKSISMLKNELANLSTENAYLRNENLDLKTHVSNQDEEIKESRNKIRDLNRVIEEGNSKLREYEELLDEFDSQAKVSKLRVEELQNSNQVLREELNNKLEETRNAEVQHNEDYNTFVNLEHQNDKLANLNESLKKETYIAKKQIQEETTKSQELKDNILHLEKALNEKTRQTDEIKREYDNLENSRTDLIKKNCVLKEELDYLKLEASNTEKNNTALNDVVNKLALEEKPLRELSQSKKNLGKYWEAVERDLKTSLTRLGESLNLSEWG